MRWVALFDDTPKMPDVRKRAHAAHLAYLSAHTHEILIAGGLYPDVGAPIVGGLWIMEAADRDEAIRLIEGDPYFVPGVRTYRLFVWGKTLEGQAALL